MNRAQRRAAGVGRAEGPADAIWLCWLIRSGVPGRTDKADTHFTIRMCVCERRHFDAAVKAIMRDDGTVPFLMPGPPNMNDPGNWLPQLKRLIEESGYGVIDTPKVEV